MDKIDYWRICDRLTLVQAAILLTGHDPTDLQGSIEKAVSSKQPDGYCAFRAALIAAVDSGAIEGKLHYETEEHYQEPMLCVYSSYLEVDSLKKWMVGKGFTDHFFFFPDGADTEFLDPEHERYAPKLAAAVCAWRAMDDPENQDCKTPKASIQKWLRENAHKFELSNEEDGTLNETAIESISKIVNWNPQGGAPVTPNSESKKMKPPKQNLRLSIKKPYSGFGAKIEPMDLDSDIPF